MDAARRPFFHSRVTVMAQSRLRIFHGPETTATTASGRPKTDQVQVRLGEILPMLADAVRSERTWLQDFLDENVTISNDLYEVILAYKYFRRPSA